MGNQMIAEKNEIRGVGLYFKGCVSDSDSRRFVLTRCVNSEPDETGRTVMFLNYSLDGKTVVDYEADSDDSPAEQILDICRSLLDGIYLTPETVDEGKTVMYCRTANGGTFGIEGQITMLYQYGEEHGYNISAAYCDCEESGLTLDRPCLQKLIADIRSGEVKRVIVTNLSRIARDLPLMYEFAKMLAEYDVELISVTDGEKVDISQLEIFTDVMRFYAKKRKGAKK